jgi:glycosylphosphatidylinositol deacylase
MPLFTSPEVCSGTLSPEFSVLLPDLNSMVELLMPPLLSHTSQTTESHFFPMISSAGTRRILLHTHNSGPHLSRLNRVSGRGINLTVYSSGTTECSSHLEAIAIRIDWWGTLGRCAGRYFMAAGTWAISVVALLVFQANRVGDKGGT